MKHLKVLLENSSMKNYLESNSEAIAIGTKEFSEFPQEVKNHIQENLHLFVGKDLNETYENIVEYTTFAVTDFLDKLTESLVA